MFSRVAHTAITQHSELPLITNRDDNDRRFTGYLIAISLIVTTIFIFSRGNIYPSFILLGIVATIAITFYRLDWGFFFFIGMVLTFDQVPPRGYETTILGYEYFQNLKAFEFLSSVDFAVVNPLELQLFLIFIVWIMLIALGKRVFLQNVPVWISAILFFFCLTISAVYGMARGGDFLPALWELRALIYFGAMYFFVPQIIQTRKQLITIIWICIGTISFKAFLGLVRVVRLGFQFGERTELTNHEDPLFFISLFIMLFGFILYRVTTKQRKAILWILAPMLLVFFLAQRRAAYVAFGIGIFAFMALVGNKQRNSIFKVMIPVLILFGIYLAVFWKSEGTIGLPAQLVVSAFSKDKETAGERYYSNLYREVENYDLSQTLKRAPLIGIGFGNKYDQPISLDGIPFSLRDYIPHNEIFWLVVKMGAVGYWFFWFFLDMYIFHAAHLFTRLKDPYLKTICAVIIIAIMGQIVVSYVDLQLTFYRNMIYLGLLMGLLPTLKVLDSKSDEQQELRVEHSL